MHSLSIIKAAEKALKEEFTRLEEIAYHNQSKVLQAFKNKNVRDYHFAASSGYGYGDIGRDLLEEIYAEVFACEDALVRGQIVSGTHAIAACLLSLLQPGDLMISAMGSPYDTLQKVIGAGTDHYGTLGWRGVEYVETALKEDGRPDYKALEEMLSMPTRLVLIQRSRGYTFRPALGMEDLKKLVETIRAKQPSAIIMVDNCYGEFVDREEPGKYDIDIMAGSLIKKSRRRIGSRRRICMREKRTGQICFLSDHRSRFGERFRTQFNRQPLYVSRFIYGPPYRFTSNEKCAVTSLCF